jgi:hemoglobin-like flavoprotein
MTPEAIAVVQKTAARASTDAEFGPSFYRHLFDAQPDTRALFPASLDEQQIKFSAQLGALMRSLDDFTAFTVEARELGARHAEYGVLPSHYAAVREALIAALIDVLGELDDATEAAWRAAFDLLAEEMQAAG